MDTTEAARLLRLAAEGRREYAHAGLDGDLIKLLEHEAVTLDRVADFLEGDLQPLYGWLPSWQWTDEMRAALYGIGKEPR
jgi:hypothetical protein